MTLNDTTGLQHGDRVMVTRPSTEEWVVAVGMSKFWVTQNRPAYLEGGRTGYCLGS